jgi:AraC-like DNA-binding protein
VENRKNAHFYSRSAIFMSAAPPLFVVSHLPAPLRMPLRVALGEVHRLAEAINWGDLSEIVRRRPVDIVVVDPTAEGGMDVPAVASVIEQFPKTPVVVYTALTPVAMSALAELSRRGLKDVVLHRVDDSPERFQKVLERVAHRQPADQAVLGLSSALDQLPTDIRKVVKQVFDRPKAFESTSDVATAAGVPLTRLYRSFRQAGIRSPRKILVAARVLRAHAYMREPGYSVRQVAVKLGYSHPRILARHTELALGVKPRHLRRRMSDEAIVNRLVEWIYDNDAPD